MIELDFFDLVSAAQNGDRDAMNQILVAFKPIIRKTCGKAAVQEKLDLEQTITEKIIKSVQTYNIHSVPDFTTFCNSICERMKILK